MKRNRFRLFFILLLFSALCLCCSCGKQGSDNHSTSSSGQTFSYEPGKTTVLMPEASGSVTAGDDLLTLDFSFADRGYFTGILKEAKKVNIQLTGPDGETYKYFMETPDVLTVFPFTAGDGAYLVLAFENVGNDQYASLFNYSLNVELTNEFLPFLYPNQYVDFSSDNQAVQLAGELSQDASTDLAALEVIYDYVISHITYDDDKAENVETGYLPDIDETLSSGKGICFDYAALTVAMLRSLSIPARLNIGYSGDIRHAWVDVYIESIGWVENAIEFKGNEWKMMDPTFAAALNAKQAADYIGDGENYSLQYIR